VALVGCSDGSWTERERERESRLALSATAPIRFEENRLSLEGFSFFGPVDKHEIEKSNRESAPASKQLGG